MNRRKLAILTTIAAILALGEVGSAIMTAGAHLAAPTRVPRGPTVPA
jgi:hypothetical protein